MPSFASVYPKLETCDRLRDSHAMPEVVHAIHSLHFSATLVSDSVTLTRCNLLFSIPFGILENVAATSVCNPAHPHCIAITRMYKPSRALSLSHPRNAPEDRQSSSCVTLEARINLPYEKSHKTHRHTILSAC